MLTFTISGADGILTAAETLTSGMRGQKVKFEFSPQWEKLSKMAVFTVGALTKDVPVEGDTAVIPASVLEKPMQTLYVGVYGISPQGDVVIPTVRMKGPFIWPGANPSGDTQTDAELEIWAQMLLQIEELKARLPETGWTQEAAQLLISVLRGAVYGSDQSGKITSLAQLLGVQELKTYSISYQLDNVNCSNAALNIAGGEAYTAVVSAYEGYTLETVSVSMGGADITAQVYDAGVIRIEAVTGNVTIAASAVIDSDDGSVSVTWETGMINNSGVQTSGCHSSMIDVRDTSTLVVTTTHSQWTNCVIRTYDTLDADANSFTGYVDGSPTYIDANDATSHPNTKTFDVSGLSYIRLSLSQLSANDASSTITIRRE